MKWVTFYLNCIDKKNFFLKTKVKWFGARKTKFGHFGSATFYFSDDQLSICCVTAGGDKGVSLTARMFFRELLRLLRSECGPAVSLLSGHDNTANLIRLGLRAQDYSWPQFAYSIAFELYEHSQTKTLHLLVRFNFEPVLLKSVSSDVFASFDSFVKFVDDYLSD